MRRQFYVLSLLVCGIILQSCNKDNIYEKKTNEFDEGAISFTSSISENQETKSEKSVIRNIVADWGSLSVSDNSMSLDNNISSKGTLETTSSLDNAGVFAYHTGADDFDADNTSGSLPNFMYNQQVTKSGGSWSYTPQKYWMNSLDKISFIAYSPFKTANDGIFVPVNTAKGIHSLLYLMPQDVENQPDLMVAPPQLNKTKADGQVNFAFKHALSAVSFSLTGNGEKVKSIGIRGFSTGGKLSMDGTTVLWSNLSVVSPVLYNSGIVYDAGQNYVTATPTKIEASTLMQANGSLMVIPQALTSNSLLVITYDDNTTSEVDIHTITPTWVAGRKYIYNITLGNNPVITDDYTNAELSNSYIINPSATKAKVYKFPIKRVNEYWGNPTYGSPTPANIIGATDEWTVGLLWQDESSLVSATNVNTIRITKDHGTGIDDYFEITIPQNISSDKRGNFVIGIAKGNTAPVLVNGGTSGGNLCLWSWHFWMTDYNPLLTPAPTANTHVFDVPGGELHRYDGPIWTGEYSNTYIMDRNVGSKRLIFDYAQKLGEIKFQHGRKDPFPLTQPIFDINGNEPYPADANAVAGKKTVEYSVNNPLQFITCDIAEGNWASDAYTESTSINWNDPAVLLTDTDKKSIFDPSPWGFKMPKVEAWEDLTIVANLMYSAEYMIYNGYARYNYTDYRDPLDGLMSPAGTGGAQSSAGVTTSIVPNPNGVEQAMYFRYFTATPVEAYIVPYYRSVGCSVRPIRQ